MKTIAVLFVLLFPLLIAACDSGSSSGEDGSSDPALTGEGRNWHFSKMEADGPPPTFRPVTGRWLIRADRETGMNVLRQTAPSRDTVFNLVLAENASYVDLDLRVMLRADAGKVDQGGGLVWRARDGLNYYVVRWNPLERNIRVYTVIDGVRTQLQSAEATEDKGWHALRVTMKNDLIEGFLDGDRLLALRDTTFRAAGDIGLWTKADAITSFRDLIVLELE